MNILNVGMTFLFHQKDVGYKFTIHVIMIGYRLRFLVYFWNFKSDA